MKKIVLALFTMLFVSTAVFAQSDLQVLAVINLNKSESITVKQLKKYVGTYEKSLGRTLSVADRKEVLNSMIGEKLVVQAAEKKGISVPDSYVDQMFQIQLGQTLGVGVPVSEKQFDELCKQQFNLTGDEVFKKQLGMSKAEVKANLKNQLMMEQYVMMERQKELQKIGPTDEEIRMAYQTQKSNLVWKDMAKLARVEVPFGDDMPAAKVKINELRNKVADKKVDINQVITGSQVANSGYIAAFGLVQLDQNGIAQIGIPFASLADFLKVLSNDIGFVSDVYETPNSYVFFKIMQKYPAKMLGISDIVQPESTVTVYEFIKNNLTVQMHQMYLQQALLEIANELNTEDNVEMKKSGDALDKLLAWGE